MDSNRISAVYGYGRHLPIERVARYQVTGEQPRVVTPVQS